jgi:nuclear transport factor 2 (NTF2) superfamily protein
MGEGARLSADQGALAADGDRIGVRFQYEWHDGNEQWEFDANGQMRRREASINDVPIRAAERRFRWPAPGPRPADHPGLSELEL